MWLAIKSVISLVVSLLLTVFPNSAILNGLDILELAEQKEGCLLNASIVSDVHIDVDWPIGEWIWANGLNDLERSKDTIDALIVSGDLTNYGDGPSIESFFNIMADSDQLSKVEKEPSGHGINIKNFQEVIYLYYIHKNGKGAFVCVVPNVIWTMKPVPSSACNAVRI